MIIRPSGRLSASALLLAAGLSAAEPAPEPTLASVPRVVASTTWAGAIAVASGAVPVEVLTPVSLQHPPEYEPRPSDLLRIARADVLLLGGFERFADRLREAVGHGGQSIQVQLDYRPDVLRSEVTRLAPLIGDPQQAQANLSGYQAEWDRSAARLRALQGAGSVRVLVQRFMTSWAELAGVEVVGTFGGGQEKPSELLELLSGRPQLVIDNAHSPGGATLAAAAGVPRLLLHNFPGEDLSLSGVLSSNTEILSEGLTQVQAETDDAWRRAGLESPAGSPTAPAGMSAMKKILIPIVVLALALGGYLLYRAERAPEDDPGRLTLYGNIDVRLVNLAFEVSGRILSMPVSEGARVEAGQVLAALDVRRLALAREVASAEVGAQRAELDKLIAGPRREEIEKFRADLAAARTEAANAERHAERTKGMADRKMASPQEYDNARTEAEAAEARAEAVRAALDLALAGSREEDIARARATLAALEGALGEADLNLAYARLVAPGPGVVQNRILEPGDMASPERPVYTIAMNEPLWARVYLAEPDLGRVRQGQPAQVFSDSFPGRAYSGWIGYISPSAEFTPKTVQTTELRADLVYQARIYVCNPAGELRQGMPVTVEIDLTREPMASPGCVPAADAATPADPTGPASASRPSQAESPGPPVPPERP